MRRRTLQNLDWLFRHYVVFCLAILSGGVLVAVVLRLVDPAATEFFFWSVSGMVLGAIIGLVAMGMLKARFHRNVIVRLSMEKTDENA